MESQPQNPELRNNPENFHPWIYSRYGPFIIQAKNMRNMNEMK